MCFSLWIVWITMVGGMFIFFCCIKFITCGIKVSNKLCFLFKIGKIFNGLKDLGILSCALFFFYSRTHLEHIFFNIMVGNCVYAIPWIPCLRIIFEVLVIMEILWITKTCIRKSWKLRQRCHSFINHENFRIPCFTQFSSRRLLHSVF